MDDDYTPTINDVREMWAEYQEPTWGGGEAHFEEFDRFIRKVKSEAWEDGYADGRFNADPGLVNPYL